MTFRVGPGHGPRYLWTCAPSWPPTPGTAGRGSTAVPGIMRLCVTTDEWLSGVGLRSLPTGLGAVIASRNGVGRVEGRRAEAKWVAAAVGTGVLCSAAVS